MGEEGEDLLEHLTKKYGPSASKTFGDPNSRLMQMGRKAGISFKTDRNIYNTIKAHALIEHVKQSVGNDKANDMMEDLYKRYFEQGENISDMNNLVDVFKDVLPEEAAREVMTAPGNRRDVLEQDQKVKNMGVRGVPFFIVEQKNEAKEPSTFSGAVPPFFLARELREAAEE